jgi:hypothetical protein
MIYAGLCHAISNIVGKIITVAVNRQAANYGGSDWFFIKPLCRTWVFALLCAVLLLGLHAPDVQAQAYQAETDRRIAIGLNLFPNILSVDRGIAAKQHDEKLQSYFVYQRHKATVDALVATFVKKIKTIKKIPVIAQSMTLEQFVAQKDTKTPIAGLFIAERLDDAMLRKLLTLCKQRHILTFSPFAGDVERGVSTGVFVGSKIRPFVNMAVVKELNIQFHPLFLKFAYHYE